MNILVLGGTGAMGVELLQYLENTEHRIIVTTRKKLKNYNNITYIQGNAHDKLFLENLFSKYGKFDEIIDFMYYNFYEFSKIFEFLLNNTSHYMFLSSSRVYSNSDININESSKLLNENNDDINYLASQEYALQKIKEENLLKNYFKKNWTIVRPYITYNYNRLQFGAYEKEQWILRVLCDKKVAIQEEIINKYTTLTYAKNVAFYIFKLINNSRAFGECIQIVYNNSKTSWKNIYDIYNEVFLKKGYNFKLKIIDKKSNELLPINIYQLKYDRYYNRIFNSDKLEKILNEKIYFDDINTKLKECLEKYIETMNNTKIELDPVFNAQMDKLTNEYTDLKFFKNLKSKIKYIIYRNTSFYKIRNKK